jgi:hypothetical protein
MYSLDFGSNLGPHRCGDAPARRARSLRNLHAPGHIVNSSRADAAPSAAAIFDQMKSERPHVRY